MSDIISKIEENSNSSANTDRGLSIVEHETALDKTKHPMEVLLKNSGASPWKAGDIVEGMILEKRINRLFVDLGTRGMGIVYGREFYEAQSIIKNLKVGDIITGKIVELDNEDGYIELSLKEAGKEKNWADLKEMMRQGVPLTLKVSEANKGGLILESHGVKGFLPVSQLSMKHYPRVEGGEKEKILQELQKFINQELKVKIIDVDPSLEKLIFSEKGSDLEELKNLLGKYKAGDVVEGEITGVVKFGAFMKFDEGLEGLIHISEIDWQLIEDPRDVMKIGDKVRAKIIAIDGEKVSLSLKALKEDPWVKAGDVLKKGDIMKGAVTKFNPFGAFVEIKLNKKDDSGAGAEEEIQGLAHISEFGSETKMKTALELGQEYEFKILQLEPKEHRLSLGLLKPEAAKPDLTTKQ